MYKNIVTATYKHRPKNKSFAERGTEVLKGFLQGYEQLETVPKFQNTFIWANQPFQSGNKKSQMWCGNQLERGHFVLECPLLWPNKKSPLWPLRPGWWLVSSVSRGPARCFVVGPHHTNTHVRAHGRVANPEGENVGVHRARRLCKAPQPKLPGRSVASKYWSKIGLSL